MNTQLKAYEVHDGNDEWNIQFSTNGAAARRNGASEIGTDFESIEHCIRKPELDQYAPGPVPPAALIAIGWNYECGHCLRRVDAEMDTSNGNEFDCGGNDLSQDDVAVTFKPTYDGQTVYCCEAHKMAEWHTRQLRKHAKNEVCEAAYFVVPEGLVTYVREERTGKYPNFHNKLIATIKVPGLTYTVDWVCGSREVMVAQTDVDAFCATTNRKPA